MQIFISIRSAGTCLSGSGDRYSTQCAPTGTVCQKSRGSIPGLAGRFHVRISVAHALRLISWAGKEGSTVSYIICDRWLILG